MKILHQQNSHIQWDFLQIKFSVSFRRYFSLVYKEFRTTDTVARFKFLVCWKISSVHEQRDVVLGLWNLKKILGFDDFEVLSLRFIHLVTRSNVKSIWYASFS